MKITILGSGTSVGVPMIACSCRTCISQDQRDKRLRTSALIEVDDLNLVIDIGPDFRQQILKLNPFNLDAILLTHHHSDHTSGLDEIRAFNFSQKSLIPIYGEDYVLEDLKIRFHYIFDKNDYPGLPSVELLEISANSIFKIKETEILPIRVTHGNLPILSFRIKDFAYITDASYLDELALSKLKGLEVLIINALRHKEHHSHFNLSQSLEMIQKINAKQTFITHISHQMGLHREVEKELPSSVHLAYDGLEIFING